MLLRNCHDKSLCTQINTLSFHSDLIRLTSAIMRYETIVCLFSSAIILAIKVTAVSISPKLDFGSDSSTTKAILLREGSSSQYKILNEEKKSSFDDIGVVCISGNCNSTSTKVEGDGVSTDVLVHVKTNVNLSPKNTTKVQVPDIPIIIGYDRSSASSQTTHGDRNLLDHENYPDIQRRFDYTTQFVPSQPEILPEPNFHFRGGHPGFRPKQDNRNYKNVGFPANGIQIQIPHRPYFINHYFGEHPPPQLVWYPKGNPSFNPLEFKRVHRPMSSPLSWNTVGTYAANQYPTSTGTTCTCQNHGLNWYPTTSSWQNSGRATKSHIDDKLASLN